MVVSNSIHSVEMINLEEDRTSLEQQATADADLSEISTIVAEVVQEVDSKNSNRKYMFEIVLN